MKINRRSLIRGSLMAGAGLFVGQQKFKAFESPWDKDVIELDAGTYYLHNPLSLTKQTVIRGKGPHHTKIVYDGWAYAISAQQSYGHMIENLTLEAPKGGGIYFASVYGSVIRNVNIRSNLGITFDVFQHYADLNIAHKALFEENSIHNNTEFNLVEHVSIYAGLCLGLYGNGPANSTHNRFIGLNIFYTNEGITLGDSDNNVFVSTFIARPDKETKGYGLVFGKDARSNYFYHLEVPGNGLLDMSGGKNFIRDYDRENGQPPL